MPKKPKPIKKDLKPMFTSDAVRFGAFCAKLYDLGAAVMLSPCRNGSVSITVFAEDDKERLYVENVETAPEILTALVDFATQES